MQDKVYMFNALLLSQIILISSWFSVNFLSDPESIKSTVKPGQMKMNDICNVILKLFSQSIIEN